MALLTAKDYIYQALRKCGQLRPGYDNSPELLADALNEFSAMYDGFNARRTMAYTIPDYIYPITNGGLAGIYGAGVQFSIGPAFTFAATATSTSVTLAVPNTSGLYIGQPISGTHIASGATIQGITINTSITMSLAAAGSGATTVTVSPIFAGPRPEAILRMNLYMTSVSPSQPTRIPLSPIEAEQWANISVIQLTPINVTTVFYYDPQFPQGVINVWPPLNGNSLEIFTWGFLTPPTGLTASMLIPPGYADVIIYELAKRLWPMCTKQLAINRISHQWLCGQAAIARADVMRVNAPMPRLANDFHGGHQQNVGVSDWGMLLTGIPY